jgi:plasmid stabilization system protein ParE
MAPPYRFSPRALDDLDDIWSYIAADNIGAANRVESAIFEACERVARYPLLGSKRADITPLPVRFWVVTRYPNFIVVFIRRPSRSKSWQFCTESGTSIGSWMSRADFEMKATGPDVQKARQR